MLSDRQLAAAQRTGQDVCVVAGPGSGKTSVLIERFAWLVRERGVSPQRILAISFTEKAAAEIKERAVQQFISHPEIRDQIERAYISTIHAFCARLLREHAIDAGVDPAFRVLDRGWLLLREAADEVLEELYAENPDRMATFLRSLAVATERSLFVPDVATCLVEIHDSLRLAGASAEALLRPAPPVNEHWHRMRQIAADIAAERPVTRTPRQAEQHAAALEWARDVLALPTAIEEAHFATLANYKPDARSLMKGSAACTHAAEIRAAKEPLTRTSLPHFYAAEREMVADALDRIAKRYRDRKRSQSALDFDDLEEFAIRLLEKDAELRRRVSGSFDYILMDELQDTNPLQWRLLELIRKPGAFFAVGDVNQSIYGFRHAEPELFGAYRQTLEAAGLAVDELRDNYRSRPELLDAVNRSFMTAQGIEAHTLSAGKTFAAPSTPAVEIHAVLGASGPQAELVEAQWVARRISELVGTLEVDGKPVRFGDIAILTRANGSTGPLQAALDRWGVPSVVLGGLTLYDTREVRDVVLILRVLANPGDEIALAGVLRSPVFGMSDEDLFRMICEHNRLSEAVHKAPPPFWPAFEELRRLRNVLSPDRLLRRVLDECDYENGLSDRARANIEKFLAMLRRSHTADPRPLADVVGDLEDAAPESEAPPPEFSDAVRLMTLHKSKGLEFPVVFLPFLHRGRSYGFPIISFSHEHGLGMKWRNPATELGEGDSVWHANRDKSNAAAEEEENRILYVGMTRAKHHLALSWSETPRVRGRWPALISSGLGVKVEQQPHEPVEISGIRVFVTDREPEMPLPEQARMAAAAPASVVAPIVCERALSDEGSASVTDISRFSECPRRYYLERYLGMSQSLTELPAAQEGVISAGVPASELGRQVHALLAGEVVPDPHPEAASLVDRFMTSSLGRQALRSPVSEREWSFLTAIADVSITGQVDLWFENGRKLTVVDYKTDREVSAEAVSAYSLQLQLYAIALSRYLQRDPDRAVLFFLREGSEVEVDVSPLSLGAAREAVHRFRQAQSRGEFPLSTGDHCRRCEFYRALCPAGRGTPAISQALP